MWFVLVALLPLLLVVQSIKQYIKQYLFVQSEGVLAQGNSAFLFGDVASDEQMN